MSGTPTLPQALAPWQGTIDLGLCEGAAEGMGPCAGPARELLERGLVPPDVLMGMTLHLLAQQPRRTTDGEEKKGAVEGGVWVREQVTVHRPVRQAEEVVLSGSSARRFVRRGRRYGVTVSETRDRDGLLLVSNCTTGLLSYRKDPSLEDGGIGVPEDQLAIPRPDPASARANPHDTRLREIREGEVVSGAPTRVTLDMMRLRDAGRNDNRIHTDPEVARREGLAAPIAGGSHVVAFLQAALMAEWGAESLLHGAHFDVRWTGQTRAGDRIVPRATVEPSAPDLLRCTIGVEGDDRALVTGTLLLPLAAGA